MSFQMKWFTTKNATSLFTPWATVTDFDQEDRQLLHCRDIKKLHPFHS